MENFFKVRKGLVVQGSGSTIVDVQGSSGQILSVTDSETGSIVSVNDILGNPLLEINNDGTLAVGPSESIILFVTESNVGINTTTPQATLEVDGNILATSYTGSFSGSYTGSFSGSAEGLFDAKIIVSGASLPDQFGDSEQIESSFNKIIFDDGTGLHVDDLGEDVAKISIGSHFRDIVVSGSSTLRATGSDAMEMIAGEGIFLTTSLVDTNGDGIAKELVISAAPLSSSVFAAINELQVTGSQFSGSVKQILDEEQVLSGSALQVKQFLSLENVDNTADIDKPLSNPQKTYVDEVAQGLRTRSSALAKVDVHLDATYNNGTSGVGAFLEANSNGTFPSVDDIDVGSLNLVGVTILVSGQNNPAHNGLYVLDTAGDSNTKWKLIRSTEVDQAIEIPGSFIFVAAGTVYANTGWVMIVDDPITFAIGTDAITITQFSGVGSFLAGAGLTLTGNVFSLNTGSVHFNEGVKKKLNFESVVSASNQININQTTGILNVNKGGTGQTTYTNGQLLIGNSTGNTLVKSTLTAGTGISITNGAGSITINSTDTGGSQNIFKNIANAGGTVQFSATENNDTIRFAGSGATTISFNSTTKTVTISSTDNDTQYSAGNGIALTGTTFSVAAGDGLNQLASGLEVDSTVVRTTGNQTIGGTKTFTSPIVGSVTGTASNVTGVVAVSNGGTGQTTYTNGQLLIGNTTGNTLVKSTLTAGSGISITNGPGTITITNTDIGANQNIFKNIANSTGTVQFSATENNDTLRFEGGGATTITFNAPTKSIIISSVNTQYTAGDGLSLTGTIFSVDATVVRTSGDQTIGGNKTFSNALILSTSGTATNHAVRADRSITINGTADQILVSLSGAQNLTANRTWTLSLPQSIATSSTPAFSGMTINGSLGVRADETTSSAISLPVFTADPSSTTRILVTRTLAQIRSDLNVADGANNYVHPNHTGDVTSVGDGPTTITNAAVTYAKIQNVTADRLLGRLTTGGSVQELTAANVRTFLNVADGANNYVHPNHSGDVTSVGDGATTISNNAVTDAKFRTSAGLSVVGRSTNTTGNVADITAASDHQVLRRSGTAIGFGAINLASTNAVSGILPIANGGTNSSTALSNNRIMKSSGGAIVEHTAITANRALISDANGIPTHSTVTNTELGYLSGVTSAIQTQLNAKISTTLASANILVGNSSNVAAAVAMSGDIIISNTGATTIGNTVVTYAKIQNVTADRLLGRLTTGGSVQELTAANVRTFLNVADGANNYVHPNHSGDVTSVGDGATTISNNAVTDAKFRTSAGLSVVGRSASTTGNVADITAASDHQVLRRSGTAIGFGAINLASANAVSGTLPVGNGGTGQTTYTNGQLLIGNTTNGTLVKATLTGTADRISITNGAGSITINAEATSSNAANKIVARDGSGNFSAGTITSALSGSINSTSATITGGSINGTTIGATTASTGAFTTTSASTSLTTPLVTNAGMLALSATGANVLTASTNGVERMRITSAGNVGIGTTSPNVSLEVAGNVHVSGGDRTIFNRSNNSLALGTNNTERMRITSAGNVGIGTSSPESYGTIAAAATSPAMYRFMHLGNSGSDTVTLTLGSANTSFLSAHATITATQNGGVSGYRLDLGTRGTNNRIAFSTSEAERMRITSAGNVGIGTTSPNVSLEVAGNVHVSGGDRTIFNRSNNSLQLGTNNTARMTILAGGNVGIGTTSVNAKLDINSSTGDTALLVRGSANSPKMLMIHAEGGNSTTEVRAGIAFSNHGGASWSSQAIGSLRRDSNGFGDLLFMLRNNTVAVDVATSDEKMRITAEGNVGIGTTTPGYKLEVNGSFAATTKSFIIDHQSQPGKKLVYGVTEGPEHSVFVRGKLNGNNKITLPEEWEWLVDENSITVQLTPIGNYQELYVESIDGGEIIVGGNDNINCYYFVQGARKDIDKLETVV